MLCVLPLLLGPANLLSQEPAAAPQYDCNRCHGDPTFLAGKTDSPARDSALHVPAELISDSRHAELQCEACHVEQGTTGYPHAASSVAVGCGTCHEAEGQDWSESVHAANVADEGDAASCVTCHSAHTVFGADDRRSLTYPLNVAELCGSCHADPGIIGHYFGLAEKAQAREAVATYFETVHGAALTRAGLTVSATCNDCHEGHRVLPASDPTASTHRDNQPETCGTCHQGVLTGWAESAHGVAYREGRTAPNGRPAPVCADCHSSHRMVRATTDEWFIGVVDECGDCHEDLYETYFETYHGKVTRLGYGMTAKCSDCHTPHAMFPPDDERSSVHPANLVATCGQCHPASTENFALYYSHGDHKDREGYPRLYWTWIFMSTLLGGVFAFFGLHTAMWLGRLGLDGYKARRRHRRAASESDRSADSDKSGS
jgi:nitrate/TMAO reductase-like tetraheme cytochrome c subunit